MLPLLDHIGVDCTSKHVVEFQKHIVLMGYYMAWRVPRDKVAALAAASRELARNLVKLYGIEMLKPKLHFSEHANLTLERFVFFTCIHAHGTHRLRRRFGLVRFTSCLHFESHLKPVKKCASGGNNKSVERTVMTRLMRIRNLLAQKVDELPETAVVRQVADEDVLAEIAALLQLPPEALSLEAHRHLRTASGDIHVEDHVYFQETQQLFQCTDLFRLTPTRSELCLSPTKRLWMVGFELEHATHPTLKGPAFNERIFAKSMTHPSVLRSLDAFPGAQCTYLAVPCGEDRVFLPYFTCKQRLN